VKEGPLLNSTTNIATLIASAFLCAIALGAASPTAELLQEIIRVDTSNPPGNEAKLARFLESKFKSLGFQTEIVTTPAPEKAHFIARLKGDGTKKPILLAAHADVVGVEREKWSIDPFAGLMKEGYVYGRGALDFKGGLAVFAHAVMMLAKNKIPLHRDVILLSEADEESGKYNTSWLADSHWDKIDCEFALNEGGWIIKDASGKVQYVSISIADKTSVSLLLTAHGTSTHSSMPRSDNAIFTLSKAMARIADYDTQPKLIDSTKEFFLTLAKTSQPPMSTYFSTLVNGSDPNLVAEADKEISKDRLLHAIMRNTIAPVFLKAGFRGNVIPGSAEATINFRIIPGTDVNELISEIKSVVNDPNVDVELLPSSRPEGLLMGRSMELAKKAKPSPKNTELYRALEANAAIVWPGAPVTTYLFQAGTDAVAWRSRGVPVYGIYPYPITSEDLTRMHGNDERVSIDSLDQGTEFIYKTLLAIAAN
jgi:acetylornithine deacetylase/succinyl-diaminopimelate desuccinylase-like protein